MTTDKFEIPEHIQETLMMLEEMPAFSGTPEQFETLKTIYQKEQGGALSTMFAFEFGKMIGKREERAKRKKGHTVGQADLEHIFDSLEDALSAEGSFVFEITDSNGTTQREVPREEFLEHAMDVLLHEVMGLIEKMEESK